MNLNTKDPQPTPRELAAAGQYTHWLYSRNIKGELELKLKEAPRNRIGACHE